MKTFGFDRKCFSENLALVMIQISVEEIEDTITNFITSTLYSDFFDISDSEPSTFLNWHHQFLMIIPSFAEKFNK